MIPLFFLPPTPLYYLKLRNPQVKKISNFLDFQSPQNIFVQNGQQRNVLDLFIYLTLRDNLSAFKQMMKISPFFTR